MIIWRGKVTTEPAVVVEDMGRRSWRWALEIKKWSIELQSQVSYEKQENGPNWFSAGPYFFIGLNRWKTGIYHIWYDGPHCNYWCGWFCVAFQRPSGECKKCHEGM